MEEKKVLTLRCCKHDFEQIVKKGEKFRYLEIKKYWESRVLEKDGTPKSFHLIHLKNGYSSDSPLAIIEFKGNNGTVEKEGINYFEIELGEILSIENYEH